MFPNLRNTVFWIFDWLQGSKVRKHYADIEKIQQHHTSDFARGQRKTYLTEILRHSIQTVPYYRKLGLSRPSLNKFPVVNKNLIKRDADSFRSDPFLSKKVFEATTSGSTGTPFTIVQDANKKKRHQADVRFYWEAVGHGWGTKFYYLKIWNQKNRKSKRVQKIENIVPVDVFKMDDDAIQRLLDGIKTDTDPKSVLGYASALDRIVHYLKRNPTDMSKAGVVAAIAMSEALDGPTKKSLQDSFDCPVVSRYANIENGMLAQQTTDLPDRFLMNFASYHIEILGMENDVAVEDGKMGRIVVTDLFNKAMPMIRYDTGDLGIMEKYERSGKTHFVLKKVEGRKMDAIYDSKGEPISSFTITNSMWKYIELAQYQFIQKGAKEYEFKLNPLEKFTREKELINEFKEYLGSDAKIGISYVEEIPLLSSGKRKKVLNSTDSESNIINRIDPGR